MPDLTLDQRIEMNEGIRYANRMGRPQDASKLRQALEAGVYAELVDSIEAPTPEALPDPPPRRGKGSGQKHWIVYAKLVSDIDPEIIDSAKQIDIIGMLEANGLIDMLPPPETGEE
jgi:hypothetical protein